MEFNIGYFLVGFLSLVSADVISINSGGSEQNPIINNQTPEEPINLNKTTKEEPNSLKRFFIKFICKLSNLFNGEKYNSCVENYLQ